MTSYPEKLPIVVTEIEGEVMRYHATSQTQKRAVYVVDLSENQGHGECFCKRFRTTCGPLLKQGAPRWTRKTSCAHLRAVWRHFTITTLTQIARDLATKNRPPHAP